MRKDARRFEIGEEIANGILYIAEGKPRNKRRFLIARCTCSKVFESRVDMIIGGTTRSCGCYIQQKEGIYNGNYKNGLSKHPLYFTYYGMMSRCYAKHTKQYKYY